MTIESTSAAAAALGVDESTIAPEQRRALDDRGYLVITAAEEFWQARGIDFERLVSVTESLIKAEGGSGGWDHARNVAVAGRGAEPGAQRLSNLVNKHPIYRRVMSLPEIVAAARHVISGEIKLSSLNMREPRPGEGGQGLHIDWRPRRHDRSPFASCVTFVSLDDSSCENGALRLIPGSHEWLAGPAKAMADPAVPHPDEVVVEAPRGTLVIVNAHLWHGGTTNRSGARRRVLFVNYRHRRLWQQLDQKRHLDPAVTDALSDAERYLLAVRPSDPNQSAWWYGRRNRWYVRAANRLGDIAWEARH